mmetsp:Transcript_15540/g.32241  ORF Transcript_15540/g.32241 Transcript_15540/m.32241 type:complete len:833 (-) Transcript_15540:1015-3513(-)
MLPMIRMPMWPRTRARTRRRTTMNRRHYQQKKTSATPSTPSPTPSTTETVVVVVRGTIIRKRKYHNHISLAVRRTETSGDNACKTMGTNNSNTRPAPPELIMVDRSDQTLAPSLEGCFVGSIIEAGVVVVATPIVVGVNDIGIGNNIENVDAEKKKKTSNNHVKHNTARTLKLVRSSTDPNAIQVCLKLVSEHKLPLAVFSWSYAMCYNDNGNDNVNNNSNSNNNDNTNSNGSDIAAAMSSATVVVPLLRDIEQATEILALGPKDKVRRAFVKRLACGLKGEGLLLESGTNANGNTGNTTNDGNRDYDHSHHDVVVGPRKRPTHIKRRHRAILEAMEASQAPLANTNTNTNTHIHNNTNSIDTNTNDCSSESDNDTSAPLASTTTASITTNSTMPVSAAYNLPDPHDPTLKSTRHPKTRREYLQDKKWPQIEWLVKRLEPILETLREKKTNNKSRNANNDDNNGNANTYTQQQQSQPQYLEILDVGGGRGDIAVAVAEAFPDVRVTVVDTNESSLVGGKAYYESRKRWWQEQLREQQSQEHEQSRGNDDRVLFVCGDFAEYARGSLDNDNDTTNDDNNDRNNDRKQRRFDVVVAWHACGDLSDYALEFAVTGDNANAFVICPCCYTKRYIRGFTPGWTGDYCVPCTTPTIPMPMPITMIPIGTESVSVNMDVNVDGSGAEEKKEDENNNADNHTNCNAIINDDNNDNDQIFAPVASNAKANAKAQHQKREQEIATIQRLAEINERPEITHRAMMVINTMRMRSLLALSSSSSTKGSISTVNSGPVAPVTGRNSSNNNDNNSVLVQDSNFAISLEEYDIAHSSKNLVLVGVRK